MTMPNNKGRLGFWVKRIRKTMNQTMGVRISVMNERNTIVESEENMSKRYAAHAAVRLENHARARL